MTIIDGTLVKAVEVASAPEVALELLGLPACQLHGKPFAEDVVPRHEGNTGKQQHDCLNNSAGVENQVQNREVLRDIHCRVSSLVRSSAGIEVIFIRAESMQTI